MDFDMCDWLPVLSTREVLSDGYVDGLAAAVQLPFVPAADSEKVPLRKQRVWTSFSIKYPFFQKISPLGISMWYNKDIFN